MNSSFLDEVESMLEDVGEDERTPAQETALKTIQSFRRDSGCYRPTSPENVEAKLQTALSCLSDGEDTAVNNVCCERIKSAIAQHRRRMDQ